MIFLTIIALTPVGRAWWRPWSRPLDPQRGRLGSRKREAIWWWARTCSGRIGSSCLAETPERPILDVTKATLEKCYLDVKGVKSSGSARGRLKIVLTIAIIKAILHKSSAMERCHLSRAKLDKMQLAHPLRFRALNCISVTLHILNWWLQP